MRVELVLQLNAGRAPWASPAAPFAANDTTSAPTSMPFPARGRRSARTQSCRSGGTFLPLPRPRPRPPPPRPRPPAAAVGLELCSRTLVAGARRAQDRLRIIFVDLQMLCDQQHARLRAPRNGVRIPTPPALNDARRVFDGALQHQGALPRP